MKVYLDSSCLNRIFDDQSQLIDYFLTVDDGILKKYTGSLRILNPVNFISQITSSEVL